MPSIPEQLDGLTLRDDFNRVNENPMVQESWTKLSWCDETGKVQEETWTPATGFVTAEDGCYWNPEEFSEPAVIGGPLSSNGSFSAERWVALWAALAPGTHSGYRLKLVSLGSSKHEWLLERVDESEVTPLASGEIEGAAEDKFALTVLSGVVRAWRNQGAEWEEIKAVEDATYKSGNVATEGRGFGEHKWDNFYAGALEAVAGNIEIAAPPASATASAPAPAVIHLVAPPPAAATASMPTPDLAIGATPSTTENYKGLPLPHPSILANPARLGPPRFTALERRALGVD